MDDMLAKVRSKNKSLTDNQSVISADVSQLSSRVDTMITEFTEVQNTLASQQEAISRQNVLLQKLQSTIQEQAIFNQNNSAMLVQLLQRSTPNGSPSTSPDTIDEDSPMADSTSIHHGGTANSQ